MLAALRGVLRDPLYRYEARRYWTRQRYVVTGLLVAGWWALLAGYFVANHMSYLYGWGSYGPYSELHLTVVAQVCWLSLLGRAPLSLLAATGAAVSIVPERVSGQLEQIVLTPVDPWRFCLARYFGRLKGMFHFWAAANLLLAAAWIFVVITFVPDAGFRGCLGLLALLAIAAVDTAAMLLVGAAVGMRFTSTSANTAEAITKTYLTALVLVPVASFLWALTGFAAGAVIGQALFIRSWEPGIVLLCVPIMAVFRLGLGAAAVFVSLRDARRAINHTFYRPGEK